MGLKLTMIRGTSLFEDIQVNHILITIIQVLLGPEKACTNMLLNSDQISTLLAFIWVCRLIYLSIFEKYLLKICGKKGFFLQNSTLHAYSGLLGYHNFAGILSKVHPARLFGSARLFGTLE